MARMISKDRRQKWARAGVRKYRTLLTYYRLSRKLLVSTRNFFGSKLKLINPRRRRNRQASEEEDHRWSNQLPKDILQLVLQRLRISDYLRCRAACRSWRETVDREIASKQSRPLPQLPWLLLASHRLSVKDDCFLSPTEGKVLKSNPPYHTEKLDCVGSIEGWLIMVDSAERRPEGFMKPSSFYLHKPTTYACVNFFLNPISGDKVMLPLQYTIPCPESNRDSFFWKLVASSVPTSPHCLVAGLCFGGYLAFCTPGDKSWTLIEEGEEVSDLEFDFHDIEIIDGKLYAMTWEASKMLIVYHIQLADGKDNANAKPHTYSAERLVMLHPRPVVSLNNLPMTRDGVTYVDNKEVLSYIFRDSASKELFMIFVGKSYAYRADQAGDPIIPWSTITGHGMRLIPPHVQGFRVFKLEHSSNGPRWVQVVDLGDRILFLSRNQALIKPAIGLNYGPHEKKIFERNCIYFAFSTLVAPSITSQSSGYDFGVFSFTNGRVERQNFLKDHSHSWLPSRPIWFTPTLG